jgi:periplasmic protein TonB
MDCGPPPAGRGLIGAGLAILLEEASMPYSAERRSGSRLVGLGFVVLLHIAIIYALVTALAHRAAPIPPAPIETKIIAAPPPKQIALPPPPPPKLALPPPPFIPPPEIKIAPPPPPPQSTAPTVITTVKPPTPVPVRVMPHLDQRHSTQPEYPPQARRLGEQGTVLLQVLVGVDGRVLEAKLLQSSGFPRLDQAALAGAKADYRFLPGTIDGKPQPMWYSFRFNWRLR